MPLFRVLASLTLDAGLISGFAVCAFACNVYDGELLVAQKTDAVPAPTNNSDVQPVMPMRGDAGDEPGPDDIRPPQRDAGIGSFTRCGDGLVTGEEKCDISIVAGQPGACPTSCTPLPDRKCAPRGLNGSACQAE